MSSAEQATSMDCASDESTKARKRRVSCSDSDRGFHLCVISIVDNLDNFKSILEPGMEVISHMHVMINGIFVQVPGSCKFYIYLSWQCATQSRCGSPTKEQQ